jgi:hypothetical protein
MKEYLADLGIANFEFVADVDNSENNTSQITNSKIVTEIVLVEKSDINNSFTSGKEKELLQKMLAAIDINIENTICIGEQELDKYHPNIVIFAGNFTAESNDFIIPHPSDILRVPELKRDAWEVLKKVKTIL